MAIKRTENVCIRMRPREAEELKALAELRGETVSELVRAALNAAVRREFPTTVSTSLPMTVAGDAVRA